MGAIRVIAGIVLLGAAGAGAYWYYKKRKEAATMIEQQQAASAAANESSVMASYDPARNNYCNPPFSRDDIDYQIKAYYWRRKLALDAWEAGGRGMNPEYFMQEYEKKLNCA